MSGKRRVINKTINGPRSEALAYIRELDRERGSNDTVQGSPITHPSERRGHIYAVRMCIPNYEHCPIKIGFSADMETRRQSLMARGPFPVEWLGSWSARSGRLSEQSIHNYFWKYRLTGEWFEPSEELLAFIEEQRDK